MKQTLEESSSGPSSSDGERGQVVPGVGGGSVRVTHVHAVPRVTASQHCYLRHL